MNSDDPTAFGHSLTDEYVWLKTEVGMGLDEIADICKNGLRAARMAGVKIRDSLDRVDRFKTSLLE